MNMTEEQKRLETALLAFIEQETKDPSPEYIKLVPEMAQVLVNLWSLH